MLKCILLSKEASLKRLYTLYPPNCTFWKRGNYKNSLKKKKKGGCQRFREKGEG